MSNSKIKRKKKKLSSSSKESIKPVEPLFQVQGQYNVQELIITGLSITIFMVLAWFYLQTLQQEQKVKQLTQNIAQEKEKRETQLKKEDVQPLGKKEDGIKPIEKKKRIIQSQPPKLEPPAQQNNQKLPITQQQPPPNLPPLPLNQQPIPQELQLSDRPLTNPIDISLDNKNYWSAKMPPKSVVLTFDDGPSPEYTKQVLNILEKYGVRATFFVVGKRVEQNCGLVREIVSRGHELGNHTYDHPFLWDYDQQYQYNQIRKTQEAIANCLETTEYLPKWFRSPYAAQNEQTLQVAHSIGLNTSLWTIDTNDWRKTSSAFSITQAAIASNGQDIILLHDAPEANDKFASPKASLSRQNTVDALDNIISKSQQKGLEFMTLSQAFPNN